LIDADSEEQRMDKRVRYLDFLDKGCSGGYTLIGSDGQTLIIRYTDIN
jgi:hypothetical protein